MCTAISYRTENGSYFGRTLDMECSYGERITFTPRRFPLSYRFEKTDERHFAVLGMAGGAEEYPLYYDALNEHGLAMAALAFAQSARYFPLAQGRTNIASFELIPWVLSRCKSLSDAKELLKTISICDASWSKELPASALHWMISDGSVSLTVESTEKGLSVFENPVGVLTNEPPFAYHMANLQNYAALTREDPRNDLGLPSDSFYSRGMGAVGLPGDFSSASRFARAVFVRRYTLASDFADTETFFHMLDTVSVPYGCVRLSSGEYEKTIYASCMDLSRLVYHYTLYEERTVSAFPFSLFDKEERELAHVSLKKSGRSV